MFNTVLLPIDISDEATWRKALDAAVGIVRQSGGSLHVLGIVPDFGMSMVAQYFPPDFEKNTLDHMKSDLTAFAEEHVPDEVTCEIHVGHGAVAQQITHIAEATGADLIVMAAHPHDQLREMLVGSNADRVVRHSDISVLVIR